MTFLYINDQYYSYTSETASEFHSTEIYITRCVPGLATTQSYQYSDRELLRHLQQQWPDRPENGEHKFSSVIGWLWWLFFFFFTEE